MASSFSMSFGALVALTLSSVTTSASASDLVLTTPVSTTERWVLSTILTHLETARAAEDHTFAALCGTPAKPFLTLSKLADAAAVVYEKDLRIENSFLQEVRTMQRIARDGTYLCQLADRELTIPSKRFITHATLHGGMMSLVGSIKRDITSLGVEMPVAAAEVPQAKTESEATESESLESIAPEIPSEIEGCVVVEFADTTEMSVETAGTEAPAEPVNP